jgi:hypothetical protein
MTPLKVAVTTLPSETRSVPAAYWAPYGRAIPQWRYDDANAGDVTRSAVADDTLPQARNRTDRRRKPNNQ